MDSKPRFNLVSEEGDGIGFGVRLVEEGYDVRAWIRQPKAKTVGDRIVPKVGDFEDLLVDRSPDHDVFIFDVSGNGALADYLSQNRFAVLGGSVLADRLERDRTFGYGVMQRSDIRVPETHSFTSFEEAIDFVEGTPETRWVYKPSKQLSDASGSHVPSDAEDMIDMLENLAVDPEIDIAEPQFELQAFQKGVAFSSELWFQHGELIEPLTNHTLERKEMQNDDLGPSGGCAGNITWFCDGCKACDLAKQLVPWASRERYHGMLDLNAMVTPKGEMYGLEFTPRFGYDAAPTLLWGLVRGDLGRFLAEAAMGSVRSLDLRSGFAGAIRVTIPPFPTEKFIAEADIPLRGIDKNVLRDHVYLYDVKRNERGELVTSGALGAVCLFINRSTNHLASLARPLEWASALRLKDKQYRTDLAKRFGEDLDALASAGVEVAAEVQV